MHVSKPILWGVGGVGALILAAAFIKKKPSRADTPMLVRRPSSTYVAAAGDILGAVGQRFGMRVTPARTTLRLKPGQTMVLPRGTADTGARVGARGVVRT